MQMLRVYIYCLLIPVTMLALMILCGAWGILHWRYRLTRKPWQRAARWGVVLMLLIWLAGILHMTVFSRSTGSDQKVYLWPFRQLWIWLSGEIRSSYGPCG